jgi:hypothetical protein
MRAAMAQLEASFTPEERARWEAYQAAHPPPSV